MDIVKLNKYKIIFDRIIDIISRGKNCLVYDYWGKIVKLERCEIWYNNKWKYVHPINLKKNKKKVNFFYYFFNL